MGFWSDLFGEPKHFSPDQKYATDVKLDGEGEKVCDTSDPRLTEDLETLFKRVQDMYDEHFSDVESKKWKIKGRSSYINIEHVDIGKTYMTIWDPKDRVKHTWPSSFSQYPFKEGDLRGALIWLEDLPKGPHVKVTRTDAGKLVDLGFKAYNHYTLMHKSGQKALKIYGPGDEFSIYERYTDLDLDLTYAKLVEKHERQEFYSYYCRWSHAEKLLKLIEKDGFENYTVIEDSINTVWLEEFNALQMYNRILAERKLDAFMKEFQRLHEQYNISAKKYGISVAAPLNSYASAHRFGVLIQKNIPFGEVEVTNWLIANDLASDMIKAGVTEDRNSSVNGLPLSRRALADRLLLEHNFR